jgi:hypothetical protein
MKRRAQCFQEITPATETYQLSPPSSIGVAIGADITPADPAVIRTGGMRAEMAGGLNLAATTSDQEHPGWRRTGYSRVRPALLLT